MRTIDEVERRSRLGRRHFLAAPGADPSDVAGGMVGLHSSDPATVYLSARARLGAFTIHDLEDALYERRTLVRMLGMRRTMFVVPIDLAAVMDAACTKALAPPERRRLAAMLEEQGITEDGSAWLDRVERATLAALERLGEATAAALTREVPELAEKLAFGEGKRWAGTVGVSTRVLFLLASEGRIVRGRPLGSWISTQYRWAPTTSWLEGGLPKIDEVEATTELLRRWLGTFGPGTVTDMRWWTGWTAAKTRAALGAVGALEVRLDGGTGYALADDVEPVPAPEPWAALLPSLDPTVMGWKQRDWYLGPHADMLFDGNGNAGPTVWWAGRAVGGWAQAANGEVVWRLLEDVGSEAEALIAVEADRLTTWLGGVRVIPRFRAPLEKELAD